MPRTRTVKQSNVMPAHVAPMLATLSTMPPDQGAYGFEYKWDGVRAICLHDGRKLRLESRNLLDATTRYPEIQALAGAIKHTAILDGEIVALDEKGRPSFSLLQRRMHIDKLAGAGRRVHVVYMIFDVLYLGGASTMHLPYQDRREVLESLSLSGAAWQTPPAYAGEGTSLLAAARKSALEGVIAKRLTSIYEPGKRSRDWLKVKVVQRQEFVVGGWTPGEGGNRGGIGSLLLGYYDADAPGRGRDRTLRFAGGVGTGFTEQDHRRLMPMLARLTRETSPFAGRIPRPNAVFVEPRLVVEIEFLEWTHAGILRHPSFKGLRSDKKPAEVVRERPAI